MRVADLQVSVGECPSDLPLVFQTDGGAIGAGYHVTELRLADVVGIDCGAQVNRWTEATMQLLDGHGGTHMAVGKFARILDQSIRHVDRLADSALRVEFAHGNRGVQLFEPTAPEVRDGAVVVELRQLRAQCKPMSRANASADTCCGANGSPAGTVAAQAGMRGRTGCCGSPAPSS